MRGAPSASPDHTASRVRTAAAQRRQHGDTKTNLAGGAARSLATPSRRRRRRRPASRVSASRGSSRFNGFYPPCYHRSGGGGSLTRALRFRHVGSDSASYT
ncbi:unnamed protein product [Merluccius merluccius]